MGASENAKKASFSDTKKRMASNPDTEPHILEKLADRGSPEIVQRVAENTQTPEPVMEKLASHENVDVRNAIAQNKNAPNSTVEPLSADTDPTVRFSIAENPSTPLEVLARLVDDENAYVAERAKQTLNRLAEVKGLLTQADELFLKGIYDKSEGFYKQLLIELEPLLGSTHIEIAQIKHKLAASLAGQGKADEALKYENESKLINEMNEGKLNT